MALESIDSIIAFWFGSDVKSDEAAQVVAARQAALWWGKDAATDQIIKTRFEETLLAASNNALDHWAETAEGLLALILLLDQFSRNIYRGTNKAFAFDELAQQCCHLGLAQGFDQALTPLQRVFFYLPLEHAEDIDDQEHALQLFRALAKQAGKDAPESKTTFDEYALFCQRHHAVIARFGRFPHRNAILGRDSSAEEIAFLKEPNSSF